VHDSHRTKECARDCLPLKRSLQTTRRCALLDETRKLLHRGASAERAGGSGVALCQFHTAIASALREGCVPGQGRSLSRLGASPTAALNSAVRRDQARAWSGGSGSVRTTPQERQEGGRREDGAHGGVRHRQRERDANGSNDGSRRDAGA